MAIPADAAPFLSAWRVAIYAHDARRSEAGRPSVSHQEMQGDQDPVVTEAKEDYPHHTRF